MSWNTNWESSQGCGKLLKPALNELRLALNERKAASLQSDTPYEPPELLSNEILTTDWMSVFQSHISAIIPLYVNHTDNEASWNGSISPPRLWTEADLILALGDTERLPVPTDIANSAKWIYQQFRIINMLRWFWRDYFEVKEAYKKSGDGATWIDAVNAYNANAWQLLSSGV